LHTESLGNPYPQGNSLNFSTPKPSILGWVGMHKFSFGQGLKGDFFLLMTMPRDVTSQMFNQEVQLQVRAESAAKADIVGHFRK
jgi:hypothetical protein